MMEHIKCLKPPISKIAGTIGLIFYSHICGALENRPAVHHGCPHKIMTNHVETPKNKPSIPSHDAINNSRDISGTSTGGTNPLYQAYIL